MIRIMKCDFFSNPFQFFTIHTRIDKCSYKISPDNFYTAKGVLHVSSNGVSSNAAFYVDFREKRLFSEPSIYLGTWSKQAPVYGLRSCGLSMPLMLDHYQNIQQRICVKECWKWHFYVTVCNQLLDRHDIIRYLALAWVFQTWANEQTETTFSSVKQSKPELPHSQSLV